MRVKVAACQRFLDQPVDPNTCNFLVGQGAQFVCLPEHYPLPERVRDVREAAGLFDERYRYLEGLSRELRMVVVGGTLTEKSEAGFYNTCYVFDSGEELGYYRKVHPTEKEMSAGVMPGEGIKVVEARGVPIGVLICADVLDPGSFDVLAGLGCRIAFVPTASPYREGEPAEEKYERDRSIFLEGARTMGCPVVKSCGVGTILGKHRLQGRSLIATPDRIVARSEPHQEESELLLIAELEV